jgi:hypothetical protein
VRSEKYSGQLAHFGAARNDGASMYPPFYDNGTVNNALSRFTHRLSLLVADRATGALPRHLLEIWVCGQAVPGR